jgi:hypothetical protein
MNTQYGFTWGAMTVTRVTEINGYVVLQIEAGKKRINIYASPTGRSLRAFNGKGKELKVPNE